MRNYLPSTRAVKLLRPRPRRSARAVARVASTTVMLSVIVPVYNLPGALLDDSLDELSSFRRRSHATELVLVDDGSAPPTAERLRRFAREAHGVTLLRNDVNRGKGHAVARGLLAARGRYRVFTDADLAYPADEIEGIVKVLEAGHDVAVACRVLPESRYLMSPAFFPYLYSRHLMSRAFNGVVRAALIPEMLDSQAGLKGMTAEAAIDLAPRLSIPGFAFDVELLYAAYRRGYSIAQAPVFFRYDSEPTTMSFLRDMRRMVADLVRIRLNGARGLYD